MSDLVSFHRMLLNDAIRMRAYRQAIRQTVRTGDVVLDVGAGSGILAMFACQAGARRVYALDRGDIIVVARELAKANGFGDRITFLHKDVRDVQLPEQVDVIVSELIGKSVLGQNMAEIIGLCQDRFLKPNGKIIPQRVTLHIAPFEDERIYRLPALPVSSEYEIDFSSLQVRAYNETLDVRVPAEALLAPGQTAYSYDTLAAANADQVAATLIFQPARAGTLHGFCAWFVAGLAQEVELSNRPPGIPAWDNLVFPISQTVSVDPGMTIELRLRGRSDSVMQGIWCWDTTVRTDKRIVARYVQSTFLGSIVAPDLLHKRATTFVPALSADGQLDEFILSLMDGKKNLDEIARRALARFPERFLGWQEALTKVCDLSVQYGQ